MGTTRFGLHYPELTDAPNGPAQLQQLAGETDGLVYRAFPCTNATRPALDTADRGFLADVGDLGTLERWDGSAWKVVANAASTGGGGTGGGGTTTISTVSATYAATAAQSISTGADVVVAFAVVQATDAAVTRNTSGAGHSFTLNQTRLWTISLTGRFPIHTDTGGRTFEIRAGGTVLAKAGTQTPTDNAWTANLSVTRKLTAGTVITAIARHSAGTGLALEPNSGQYVHIDFAGV